MFITIAIFSWSS